MIHWRVCCKNFSASGQRFNWLFIALQMLCKPTDAYPFQQVSTILGSLVSLNYTFEDEGMGLETPALWNTSFFLVDPRTVFNTHQDVACLGPQWCLESLITSCHFTERYPKGWQRQANLSSNKH